ncbi:protein adenylyltransferase SelO [Quadrisphaera oryzae]|uniref:protein adenylyltransferase SelO n=1 Tax=Quadrisphaera TaxID=317661 RepID=UPI001646FB17|nr:YdiU family protein [Quadrisphaera sp. RL12-1S]MBC3763302.1 YdiU family protein [Quadrisphaera sp. RL12-1S]
MSAPATTPSAPAPAGGEPRLAHAFADALPELAVPWQAAPAPAPRLLVLDDALAVDLGLDPTWLRSPEGVHFLTGGLVPDGATPVAQVYAGHQFGGYSPRLGDGRALLLGELTTPAGEVRDLHLKGSGRTPLSRGGDGLAAVGPMLREHVISSAMHALGVPTTQALAVVATGRDVQREVVLPGAVLARTASSHLRVGSFQYARATGDTALLRRLADVAIARHHPQAAQAGSPADQAKALLDAVIAAQADLVAQWVLLGFVHGVMNTDNTTISGETIDYGPCAFVDAYDPAASFSSIDHQGRYAYGAQPGVLEWNLARFAEALLPLLVEEQDDDEGSSDRAVAIATESLGAYRPRFAAAWRAGTRRKLGLAAVAGHDDEVDGMVTDLLRLAQTDHVDHTGLHRRLADAARAGSSAPARDLFLDREGFDAWAARWLPLAPDAAAMDAVNPVYVPRNHLVEEALAAATGGDLAPLERLVDVVTHPYVERPGWERYAEPAPDAFGPYTTFCGT